MAIDKRIESLLRQILNPEDLGYAASPALRDTVRFALGQRRAESNLVAFICADADMIAMMRLHAMALVATAEYDYGIRSGDEPHYPAWAFDVVRLMALFFPSQCQ